MVYSFILKVVKRNLHQYQTLSTQSVLRICKCMQNNLHLQKPSTATSRFIFYRTANRSPIVSDIFCTRSRSISVDTRLRSKGEEKDGGQVSVPRKGPSTAHKGKPVEHNVLLFSQSAYGFCLVNHTSCTVRMKETKLLKVLTLA